MAKNSRRIVRVFKLDSNFRDVEAGQIRSDGKRIDFRPNTTLMQCLVTEPIVAQINGKLQEIGPDRADDFLDCLSQQYRGAYLRVGCPEPYEQGT